MSKEINVLKITLYLYHLFSLIHSNVLLLHLLNTTTTESLKREGEKIRYGLCFDYLHMAKK